MRLHIKRVCSVLLSAVMLICALSVGVFADSEKPEVILTSEIDAENGTVALDVSVVNLKGYTSAAVFVSYSDKEVEFISASDPETGLSCADRVYTDDCVISAAVMASSVFDEDEYSLGRYVFKVLDSVGEVTFKILGEKPFLSRAFDENESPVLIGTFDYKAFEGCFHSDREIIPGYAPTCTEPGLSDGAKCKSCGKIVVEQKELAPLGHDVKDGICTVCGAKVVTEKPTLKDGADYIIDYDKKTVTVFPAGTNPLSVLEFRSRFNESLLFGEDAFSIVNGLKFVCGDEYTIILKGDVNSDGRITASDARTILRIAARLETPGEAVRASADINSDGKTTSAEARSVLRFSARLSQSVKE